MSQSHDSQDEPQRPPGISLGELTEAFAEAMGTRPQAVPQEETARETVAVTEESLDAQEEPEPQSDDDDADPCPISPLSIIEAMLFVGNRESQPLSSVRAAEVMRGVEPEDIDGLVEQLNVRYSAGGRPYHIVQEGGGYRLTLRSAYRGLQERFYGRIREARLSQPAIDVLAIIAYRQPLTSEQISRLRGKPCSHLLAQLVRRGLLRIERMDNKRRTAQYFTTDRFLGLFGMEDLDDLPRSEEVDQR